MEDGNIVEPEQGEQRPRDPERRLLENERRRLEAVLQQMPDGVLAIEAPTGRILAANRQMTAIIGRKLRPGTRFSAPEDFAIFEGYHLDGKAYRPHEWPLARSLFEGEAVAGEEIELVREDGSVTPVRMSSAPVHDADGSLIAAVGLTLDISESRRADAELRAAERRQRRLIAELAQARHRAEARASVAALLNSGRALDEVLRLALASAAQALGIEDGSLWLLEADGTRLRGAAEIRPTGRIGTQVGLERSPNVRQAIETGQPVFNSSSERIERFASPGSFGTLVCPLLVGPRCIGLLSLGSPEPRFQPTPEELEFAQSIAAQCAVAIDRAASFDERTRLLASEQAARKQAEAAAATSRAEAELRERLMAVVGHDLRSPLNAITTSAYLLLKKGELSQEQVRGIARIERAARRMARMIGELLDFTRAQAQGGLPIEPRGADLCAIARRAIDELQPIFPDRQLELRCEGDSRGTWDPDRLVQVASNVIGNALEYGEASAPVQVEVRGEQDEVVLEVRNAGPPIPSADLANLFEPFRRPSRAGRSASGLGLGLYIVREVARAHGGRAAIESTAEKGTVVSVRLPRHR